MYGKRKIVVSNKIIEVYKYDNYFHYGERIKNPNEKGLKNIPKKKENKLESRQLSNFRSKRNLKRLINSNAGIYKKKTGDFSPPVFLTITFAENITDVQQANKEFTNFLKRLNYWVWKVKKNKLKYAGVIEFQKRGAVHYHVVFFNLKYITQKEIADIWSNGFIKINKVKNIFNLGSYVCKYMSKNLDDKRLCGKKAYFTSKQLEKPVEIMEKNAVEAMFVYLENFKPVFEKNLESEFMGKFKYSIYNLP
jgi:hypothetical protein